MPDSGTPARILVVEDEALIAEEIRDRLARLGFAVIGLADTGEDALALARAEKPDLVLMDIRIRGPMDGIDTAERIYAELGIPVVYSTAHSDHATLERAMGTAQFGYVLKPFRERELRVAIEMALRRHRVERNLKEGQLAYDAILAGIGEAVLATDSERRVRFANPAAEALLGVPLGRLLGRRVEDVAPLLDADRREPIAHPATLAQMERTSVTLPASVLLATPHAPVPVEADASPVLDAAGKVLGSVLLLRNVGERQRMQEELRRSEQRFRGMTDLFASYSWELDENLRVSWISGRGLEMFGLRPDEIIGKSPEEIGARFGFRYLNITREAFDRLRSQRQPYRDLRGEMHTRSGERVYLAVWGEPVFDRTGRFEGYRGVTQDITDRVRLEMQVQQLNETLERRVKERTAELDQALQEMESFSYSVSHDLRAPLRAIAGFSRMLVEDESRNLSPEGLRLLGVVDRNAVRMGELIDDLLALARLSRQPLERRRVDLSAVAEQVITELRAAYPRSAVRAEGVPPAHGDRTLLQQLLANLIDNGLKYSSRAAEPTVQFGWDAPANAYYVRDNGVGFDMAHAGKIFGTFQRLHTDREFPGTGIGLAIVRRIVERHEGQVWIDSEPGAGTTVWFSLPA